jgi:hypothetical protein
MQRTVTKSSVQFATTALVVAQQMVPPYGHRSRKEYTQPQLLALLALRQFWHTDYRTTVTWVAESTELRQALALRHVPHYSTLCYAEHRLLPAAKRGTPSA